MSQGRWRIVTVAFVSLIVLAGGFVDTAGAQSKPEGEMRWALYVTLSPCGSTRAR